MPSRLLKATANKSKKLNAVSDGAQALWFRLLTCVDDYGRFDSEPALVAAATYPLRHNLGLAKVAAWLKELADIGLIVIYSVNGDSYLQFTNWDTGNIRAKKSKFPEPDNTCLQMKTDANNGEQKRSYSESYSYSDTDIGDGVGTADKPPTPTKKFTPPTVEEVAAYCRERCNSVVAQSFVGFYESNGWKVGKNQMKNWKAAVRYWETNGFSNGGATRKGEDFSDRNFKNQGQYSAQDYERMKSDVFDAVGKDFGK